MSDQQNQALLGETILFVLPNKEVTPAMVTRVRAGNRIDVSLFNNTDAGEFHNNSIHQNVAYNEDSTVPATWHHRQKSSETRQAARA